jgi:hypothetical protein
LSALGGRAFGAVSFGGHALGLFAFGGVGLGAVGIGGLGPGVYAIGGGAIGWRSAGGLAIGWDVACGGGAFAWHAAAGGAAVARDYAVGGEAHARHANDEEARAVLRDHPFARFALTVMGGQRVLGLAGAGVAPAQERYALENGLTVMVRPIPGLVANALAPPLRDDERAPVRQMFALFLGTAEIPDFALARNPYGVALALARREQLGIDPARLNRAFDALTEPDLRRAANAIFAPSRHAGAFISPGK